MIRRVFGLLPAGAIAIALFVAVAARPAAADTGVLHLAEPTNYTAPCPVTLHFSGTITGAPSSAVTYYFARYVGGSWTNTANVSTAIPTSGILPVSSQLVVDAAHAGFQSYELKLSVPSSGNDLSKAKIYFTVTCGPTPTPTPPPAPKGPPAPTNLKTTTDPGVCGDHVVPLFGALICGAALKDGDLVLVWDYANVNSVDGFHIYRTDGGYKQVDQQSGMTGKGLSIKAADAKSMCFIVRAYKGGAESADSNSTCTPPFGIANYHQMNLPLANYKTTWHWYHYQTSAPYCGLSARGTGPDAISGTQIIVGYSYFWDGGSGPFPCQEAIDYNYRGAIRFDMGPMAGHKLWSAFLTFTNQDEPGDSSYPTTCASEIMYGQSDWTGANDLIPGDPYRDLQTGFRLNYSDPSVKIANGTNISINVTDAVRSWLLGSRPNWGFVFRGAREDYPKESANCQSYYGNFVLSVDYF